mmetsp:Transcript_72398/g.154969  ORF Transcript_72398/g.154969 Transcript_72398/m.154969 type:complete len:213 (+) Transcript_72398:297-935(+)
MPVNSVGSATAGQMTASRIAPLADSKPMTSANEARRPNLPTSTRVRCSSAFTFARLSSPSSLVSVPEPAALAFAAGPPVFPPEPAAAAARSWRNSLSSLAARFRWMSSCSFVFAASSESPNCEGPATPPASRDGIDTTAGTAPGASGDRTRVRGCSNDIRTLPLKALSGSMHWMPSRCGVSFTWHPKREVDVRVKVDSSKSVSRTPGSCSNS